MRSCIVETKVLYFNRSDIAKVKVRCRTKSPVLHQGPGLHLWYGKSPGSHVWSRTKTVQYGVFSSLVQPCPCHGPWDSLSLERMMMLQLVERFPIRLWLLLPCPIPLDYPTDKYKAGLSNSPSAHMIPSAFVISRLWTTSSYVIVFPFVTRMRWWPKGFLSCATCSNWAGPSRACHCGFKFKFSVPTERAVSLA